MSDQAELSTRGRALLSEVKRRASAVGDQILILGPIARGVGASQRDLEQVREYLLGEGS